MYLPSVISQHFIRFSTFSLLLISFAACNEPQTRPGPSGFADVSFSEKLRNVLPVPDSVCVKPGAGLTHEDIKVVYAADDYQPVWVRDNYSPARYASRFIDELEDTRWDGAPSYIYDLDSIRALHMRLDTNKHNNVADAIRFDTALTGRYLAAAKFLLFGEIFPRRADSLWYLPNDSVWKAPAMLAHSEGGYPSLGDFRSQWPTYRLLRKTYRRYYELSQDSSYLNAVFNMQPGQKDSILMASMYYITDKELPGTDFALYDSLPVVKSRILAYQFLHSLYPSGRMDSTTMASMGTPPHTHMLRLRANMERLRWMKRVPEDTLLFVNVPLMELFLHAGEKVIMHKRVVVGKPSRQTPSLMAAMTNIVINPPWGVPPTILKKDVLPGIQKSGGEYLAKKGLRVYDFKGKPVNASTINARNYRRYQYRQAPGSSNALGCVKFNMPNKWDIYLHDTPHREDFGRRNRALSSGCVRVHRPMEMAHLILSGFEGRSQFTPGRLDTLAGTHRTKSESLKRRIPVYISYITAFEDTTGINIRFAGDVYHRDEKLMNLLPVVL